MPEYTYEANLAVPITTIWDFVQDMDNWAPFVQGYQAHEKKSDRRSIWTLKGDVGVLKRTVQLDVNITEWDENARVEFTLGGIGEDVDGGGTFLLTPLSDRTALSVRPGAWTRFVTWMARLIGRAPARIEPENAGAKLSFRLRMDAGGPMAPMINAMLAPAMGPATQALGEKIVAALDAGSAAGTPTWS